MTPHSGRCPATEEVAVTLYGSARVRLYNRVREIEGLKAQLEKLQAIEREANYKPEDILAVRLAVWAAHDKAPQP